MFSFFKKTKHNRLDDCVYMSRQIADAALAQKYKDITAEGGKAFVFYFFPESAMRLRHFFPEAETVLCDVKRLGNELNNFKFREQVKQMKPPLLLFAEHHPHFNMEEKVIAQIEELCTEEKAGIQFYMGLDEPLMQRFDADKIIGLMQKMGMKESDVIVSSMVTKSIIRAQQKIAANAGNAVMAASQEEWMKLNLRD